ncbi:MAG TPA: choice-of-anchor P family protein [Thermoleophilaceae bacterium]|nr:choice-of-anchor P family protein [Thermoleophilaceae bacterium]
MTGRYASRAVLSALGAAIALSAFAPAALAAPNGTLQCRATVLKVTDDNPSTDDVTVQVANEAANPCRNHEPPAKASAQTPSHPAGTASASVLSAKTELRPATFGSAPPVDGDGASATAAVSDVTITSGTNTITARVLYSLADVTCAGGIPVLTGASEVTNLTINGQPYGTPDNGAPATYTLQDGNKLYLNKQDVTGTALIQTAMKLDTAAGRILVAEAGVSYGGSPCEDLSAPPPPTAPARFDCTGVPIIASKGQFVPIAPFAPFSGNPSGKGCPNHSGFAADTRFINGDIEAVSLRGETKRNPSEPFPTPLPNGSTADADAKVGTADLKLGSTIISFRGLRSAVKATCAGGGVAFSGNSQVLDLVINGNATIVGSNEQTIPLGVGTLYLNREVSSGTQRARYPFWFSSPQFGTIIMGASVIRTYKTPCA